MFSVLYPKLSSDLHISLSTEIPMSTHLVIGNDEEKNSMWDLIALDLQEGSTKLFQNKTLFLPNKSAKMWSNEEIMY